MLIKITGFAYLAFFSQRNVAPFAIIAAPTLANWAYEAAKRINPGCAKGIVAKLVNPSSQNHTPFLNSIILALLLTVTLARAYTATTPEKVREAVPYEALHWLQKNPPKGHLFNSYNWGGYLEWTLPQTPTFIDGRADLYGKDIIAQWREVTSGTPTGFAILDQWKIQTILLEPSWPVVKVLPNAGWHEAYRDKTAVIFTRAY